MKLQCAVETVDRALAALGAARGKRLKSTLVLGRQPRAAGAAAEPGYFLLLWAGARGAGAGAGARYPLGGNVQRVFVRCLEEGKATVRFAAPPHDLCIQAEPLQLKCFVRLLRACLAGGRDLTGLSGLSSLSAVAPEHAPTKMTIRDRSEFPARGLPRTLVSLCASGLKLCNFRREILMLRHLTKLDLSNNEMEKLPPEFGRMPCISELMLGNNKLGVYGDVDWRWLVGPQLSKSLRYLDLSGNALGHITKSIWKLGGLVTLKLDNNMLSSLPASLGRIRTLRYLTISSNELVSLPCSLMQCKLEYIDLSSNKFHKNYEKSTQNIHSLWDLYVGDLVRLASSSVLKNKIKYANNIIPYTLVDFLDNSCSCVCGSPVLDKSVYKCKRFELKDFFTVVVFDNNRDHAVHFDCYFCSKKCFNNVMK